MDQIDFNATVWPLAVGLPLILTVAWCLATVARWILRSRAKLGTATAIIVTMLAASIGLVIAGLINPVVGLWEPLPQLLVLAMTVVAIAVYGAIAAHLQRPQQAAAAELLAAGESERVEFKSTARINLHTKAKDERMEQVIAKTCCAFLNADGGTLLIGVSDAGDPLGLELDLATMKQPDHDRYELWLRDFFIGALGQSAAAGIRIDFPSVEDAEGNQVSICRVVCRPSASPVYVRPNKGAAREFWVRSGNSTRQLAVDEATEYVMHRWPLSMGSSMAAQARAAVRFSEGR